MNRKKTQEETKKRGTFMSNNDKVLFRDGVHYYKNSWKQEIGNITKVYVKGTDYERGIQFGKLLSFEIKSVLKHFLSFNIKAKPDAPAILKWVEKWLPFLIKPVLFLFYRKTIRQRIGKYPEWMIKEVEGMAKGAKIHPFYLKFMNAIGDEDNALGDNDARSCSSFAFIGKDDNLYHGKNLDWVLVGKHIDFICLHQHEDEKGDWFSIIGPPGFLNAYEFGMNSHGISIGLTGRFYRGKRASKQVLTNAIELKILRRGRNLKEIQKIYDTKTGFTRTDSLLISSIHDKDYKLFEVTPIGAAVTSSTNGALFNTNTYIHPVFHKYNKQWGTIFNHEFCDPRHKRLHQLMSKKTETLDHAFEILADTLQPGFEHKSFFGQATINRFITHVSALMVQGENPGVWIAKDYTYAAYSEYSFFDFSGLPQENFKKRPANKIIYTEKFKNFKDFMHTREMRYYESPANIIKKGRRLLEKEPGNPVFILFLAQNYLKCGKPDQAVTLLENHPIQWVADYWYCLGRSKLELVKYEEAKKCFIKARGLPCIDGFSEMVEILCLVQLVKINEKMGLHKEVQLLRQELENLQSKFATPNIGMPVYPYINNIIEQMEQVVL
jgi:hypothetical protein